MMGSLFTKRVPMMVKARGVRDAGPLYAAGGLPVFHWRPPLASCSSHGPTASRHPLHHMPVFRRLLRHQPVSCYLSPLAGPCHGRGEHGGVAVEAMGRRWGCATSQIPTSVATRRPLPWERRTWVCSSNGCREKMRWSEDREIALPGPSFIAAIDAPLLLIASLRGAPHGVDEEETIWQGRDPPLESRF